VLQGNAIIELADLESVPLSAGDSALLLYGDRHRIGTGSAAEMETEITLHQPAEEEPAALQLGITPPRATVMSCGLDVAYLSPTAFAVRAAPPVWRMGHALTGDLTQWRNALHGPGATAFANILANLQLVHSMREMYMQLWRDRPMQVRAPAIRGLAAAIQAIHLQPDRAWTVAGLAREVGMSRSRFAATFTANVGITPLAYVTKVRMTRAAQLLEAATIPIAEVARRAGYPVQASFTRVFTSFHGVSPKQFVGQHRAVVR
jgi:AraC-like DNA-binding protein